jgi:DeoR/GlpR family transcriptional regulator of sugar metabolism
MEPSERHRLIIESLQRSERVTVAELAGAVDTSEVTIRRDLESLAAQGVLRRVRGGATSLMLRGEEPPFPMRELDSADAKRRIAAAVAELIADGEAVAVDSGTTGLEVARALAGRRLTVMPLSLHAAGALAAAAPTRVILPGGELRPVELTATGPLAEAGLRALRFDTAVITCCGMSAAHGLTAHDLADAAVKSAAIRSAGRVVVAADAGKFARTAMAAVCPFGSVDVLVTDTGAPPEALDAVSGLGVEVLCV